MPVNLSTLTIEMFEPLKGHDFKVGWEGVDETLRIESLRLLRGPAQVDTRHPFAVIFKGSSDSLLLDQHIHPLHSDVLGDMEIFLVPVGRNDDGTFLYEAVFN